MFLILLLHRFFLCCLSYISVHAILSFLMMMTYRWDSFYVDYMCGDCWLFHRAEIDHLTALMRSRTVNAPVRDEEKRTGVVPSEPMLPCRQKEEHPKTPTIENVFGNRLILTPHATSIVREFALIFMPYKYVWLFFVDLKLWFLYWVTSHIYCFIMSIGSYWGCCFTCRACKSLHGEQEF